MNLVDRDRILLMGSPGSGKSQAIVDLALCLPNSNVFALDLQDSIAPLLSTRARLSEALPDNLVLHRIGGSPPDAWDELNSILNGSDGLFASVGFGDWVCFDCANDFWQLAQDAYVEKTYGVQMATFKEMKVVEAKQGRDGAKGKKVLGFGGLDNDDWSVIKPKYYNTIPKALSTRCIANVLVTVNEKTPAHWQRGDEMVFMEANLPGQYKKEMVKPHGEGQLTSQVDVVLWLRHPNDRAWTLSTIGKNRYRVEIEDEDVTGVPVWTAFCMAIGRDPEKSPGAPEPAKEEKKKGKK